MNDDRRIIYAINAEYDSSHWPDVVLAFLAGFLIGCVVVAVLA